MRRTSLALTALTALIACPAGRADIRNPDIRDVSPRMAFPGVEKHPDHVFLLRVSDKSYWGPADLVDHVIPITGPEPFTPETLPYIDRMTVLAVPRRTFEKLDAEARAKLSPDTPGVLSCDVKPPATFRHVDEPEPGVVRHRIAIVGGKLVAKPVAARPGDTDSSAAGWPGRRSRAVWAVAFAASLAWLGITVGRRLRPAAG